ncbi:MAG: hypothetical protein QM804_12165 [Propionicimonas sp.]
MRKARRSAGLAGLIALALAGIVTSSAASIGAVHPAPLGAAQATTQRITGVNLDWSPVGRSSHWRADAVTISTDPGQEFQAGDRVKLTIVGTEAGSCELTRTTSAGTTVGFDRSALATACGSVNLDDISWVAVALSGEQLSATFSSGLGEIRGTLAAFSGAVVNPERTLRGSTETRLINNVSHLSGVSVQVAARGLSTADLAGTRVIARLYHTDTDTVFEYAGTISLDRTAPIHVEPAADGSGLVVGIDTIALADRDGTARPRVAQVNRFSVALSEPQHLGANRAGAADYAFSSVTGTIAAVPDPTPKVSTALEPVNLDQRLTYQYPATTNFDGNSLAFCHNFSVTNTSDQAIDWTLTFDTSLVPLWGFDPTAPDAFASTWNWETVSYDPAGHRWTIRGKGESRVVKPGATVSNLGYCTQNVPTPPVDPASFTASLKVSSASAYWMQLSLSVTSTSTWNRPWEITVDLADLVCPAGLPKSGLSWGSGVEVTQLDATRYTLRGKPSGNTRFVAASRPITIAPVVSYAPLNGQYQLPCGKAGAARTDAAKPGSDSPAPTAQPQDEGVATEPEATVPPEAPVETSPTEPEVTAAPDVPVETPRADEPSVPAAEPAETDQ